MGPASAPFPALRKLRDDDPIPRPLARGLCGPLLFSADVRPAGPDRHEARRPAARRESPESRRGRRGRREPREVRRPVPGDGRHDRLDGPPVGRGVFQRGLVAEPARPLRPAPEPAVAQPAGRGLRLRRGVQETRPRRGEERRRRADDRFAGLVARRLRPLRAVLHPHGVAQRRHLPHVRRPRRGRQRHAAVRPAQQLAGQHEPRQGPPAALAGQAKVRPQAQLGRPDDPHRHRGPGGHGPRDVRLRRRPRGPLGTGSRHLLGPRDRVDGQR